MSYWDDHDKDSPQDRAALGRVCYELTLKGYDRYQIAEQLEIPLEDVGKWSRTGQAEDIETDRTVEIARVNRWNTRLEDIWESLRVLGYGPEQLEQYIHRFISSFERLSKGRRALGGLDAPARTHQTVSFTDATSSVDDELQKLAAELGLNGKST